MSNNNFSTTLDLFLNCVFTVPFQELWRLWDFNLLLSEQVILPQFYRCWKKMAVSWARGKGPFITHNSSNHGFIIFPLRSSGPQFLQFNTVWCVWQCLSCISWRLIGYLRLFFFTQCKEFSNFHCAFFDSFKGVYFSDSFGVSHICYWLLI